MRRLDRLPGPITSDAANWYQSAYTQNGAQRSTFSGQEWWAGVINKLDQRTLGAMPWVLPWSKSGPWPGTGTMIVATNSSTNSLGHNDSENRRCRRVYEKRGDQISF